MIKQTVQRFHSRNLDGSLMYPGDWLCTWGQFGGVWMLLAMFPMDAP